ncbi:MAG: hypothetical protein LPL29_14595 [Alphaproteobacteria bacterium]|nr:hypothetical protein [Alphaproteobacteria bacterium]
MAQNWNNIPATQTLESSRQIILDRDEAAKSLFAGTAFPTTNLVVGMPCFRTDENKLYILKSIGPDTWTLIADLAGVPLFTSDVGTAAYANTGTGSSNVPTTSQADGRYGRKSIAESISALWTFAAGLHISTNRSRISNVDGSNYFWFRYSADDTDQMFGVKRNGVNDYDLVVKDGGTIYTLIHTGNDGAGSGLDADLLDGQHGSYYRNASNLNAGTVPNARLPSNAHGTRTVSTGDPTGGADGDIWLKV